jgi:hypothetical protein
MEAFMEALSLVLALGHVLVSIYDLMHPTSCIH